MIEVALKANNNVANGICSIPSKFHMLMYDRIENMYTQNQ